MIKLELYPILLDNRESLRETSKDDSDPNDIQYMTSSETEVVNFDLVKRHYVNGFGLSEHQSMRLCHLRIEYYSSNLKTDRLIIATLRIKRETACWFFLRLLGKI